ncbi:hypothetical protein XENTR_v10020338 [Xenopus tropicalis]|nr:hypothetical protein XENTR_v10020338 [Xenopus tropicalis]
MFIAHFPRIFPACVELMERYIRVGAHFWPDYTGGGTYHEQERRRIREELQGLFDGCIYSLHAMMGNGGGDARNGLCEQNLQPVGPV